MSEIIGSTYELLEKIGSGGGGVVYLARHLRLDKQIVLKADKRKITTRPELLRREVDVLKNLSHPYIPQVYDFFTDGETVYTAMEYVDGESLDKALKRGERFFQPQVIKWAKQLLQALEYLHSPTHGTPPHGYVHSDIKPANLMRRTNGDICLIDFNISLALGEDNIIGASAGYASPEHYGLDFSSYGSGTTTQDDRTLSLDNGTQTLTLTARQASSPRKIVPDIRSDIYSTGATLYHLLSGRRPAKNAIDVQQLTEQEASPQLSKIIAKAMEPNCNLRYQTASEMLWDLDHLRDNDPRTKRHKRQAAVTTAILSLTLATGLAMTFVGLRQMERSQAQGKLNAEIAEQALAAVTDSENAYRQGDVPLAVERALEALKLDSSYAAQAQLALTNALGVYNLSDGFQSDKIVTLPSEPLRMVLSPGGTRLGVVTAFHANIIDLNSGETLVQLPMEPSALSELVFPDEERLIYAGEGAVTAYDLTSGSVLWTGQAATGLALSGNGARIAAVYKDGDQAQVYDTASGALVQTVSFQGRRQAVAANDNFADAENDLFALDSTGKWLAVSFSDGTLVLFDLTSGEELELFRSVPESRFEGGFFHKYFSFSSWDGEESVFAAVDMEQLAQVSGFSAGTPFHVQTDEDGIYLSSNNLMVQLDPATGEQTELAYPEKDIALFGTQDGYTITVSAENGCTIFDGRARKLTELDLEEPCDFLEISGSYAVIGSRNTSSVRLLKQEDHQDANLFSYDPSYIHQEARLSADGSRVMLFSYNSFCLYDMDGRIAGQAEIPSAGQVYDQQFRRAEDETSYLEVFYNDGTVRSYSAQDGSLIEERMGEKPNEALYEEFFTDHLRITSPLHDTPAAYDRETGELVSILEEDAYLTYVTQVGDCIITEYVSAQGERYGLLLNEQCQVLARLPNLCDVVNDRLVFDYPSGNLRQCRIYSLSELMALAE